MQTLTSLIAGLLFIGLCSPTVDAAAIERVVAVIGKAVTLLCRTSNDADVLWTYSETDSSLVPHWVYSDGNIINGYRGRFTVEEKAVEQSYDLTIRSVRPEDAGFYTCIENGGIGPNEKQIHLVVEQEPSTSDNIVRSSPASTSTSKRNPSTEERDDVNNNASNPVSTSVIIGIAIGCVVVVIVVCVVITVVIMRSRSRRFKQAEKGANTACISTIESSQSTIDCNRSNEVLQQQLLKSEDDQC